jgi:S1-C subfamily serine protease
MREQPAKGVSVYEDSSTSRRVRLQAGDIIVGVDGFVVENKEQYEAIVAFSMAGVRHKLTAWRGVLFTVELPENHGMVLEDHPLRGWIK